MKPRKANGGKKAKAACTTNPKESPALGRYAAMPDDSGRRRKGLELQSFCGWDGDTLVLNILGQPNASKDAIGKPKGRQLQISVTVAPVAGRATDHMVRFLAKAFDVAVGDIEVVFGRFNVNKQLRIKSPGKLPAVISKELSREVKQG
jgi:uncharacterized protein (TIGR00251 family)